MEAEQWRDRFRKTWSERFIHKIPSPPLAVVSLLNPERALGLDPKGFHYHSLLCLSPMLDYITQSSLQLSGVIWLQSGQGYRSGSVNILPVQLMKNSHKWLTLLCPFVFWWDVDIGVAWKAEYEIDSFSPGSWVSVWNIIVSFHNWWVSGVISQKL